ncbi:hypothetical protein D3C78_1401610 [compost metagenome]
MVTAAYQQVLLAKQLPVAQLGGGFFPGQKTEVDHAIRQIATHVFRRCFADRQAGLGCCLPQFGQHRQQDGIFGGVGGGQLPGHFSQQRIKGVFRRQQAAEVGQRLAQRRQQA